MTGEIKMKRLINIQIRFFIGTVIMWFIGTVIFGVNLTVYGVTEVIRWATYIQGAFLLITSIGWPQVVVGLLRELIGLLYKSNENYGLTKTLKKTTTSFVEENVIVFDEEVPSVEIIEMEQFVLDIEKEFCKEKVDKTDETKKFLLEVENSIRVQLPLGVEREETRIAIRKSMSDDEKIQFDALWMALDNVETSRMILESKFPKLEK
jgi:hypothetical protein